MKPERWKEVDELFDAVLQIEPDKRGEYLARACAGDENLRKEVEALLSSDNQANSFIENPASPVALEMIAEQNAGLSSGQMIGPYKILSLLAKGGMGEVFRAKDTRLDREVAVKILTESLSMDSTALSRFVREAKALAALSHPNILAIYDFGTDQGLSYAVMELLKGQTLRQHLNVSQLSLKEGIKVGIAIVNGLAAAHSAGVIHRDLKPENIFITTDGVIKILDFGLARRGAAAPQVERSATTFTESEVGLVIGTVPYMSPEQVRGEKVDPRTDIFSFGAVIHEMLSGKRLFARNTPAETIAAILDEKAPEAVGPAEVNRIIQRCLEKNADQRFQSAHDLLIALKSASTQLTVLDRSISSILKKIAPKMLILLLTVMLTIAGWYYTSIYRSKVVESLAILPFANANKNPDTEYLSDGISESILTNVSQLQNLKVMARDTVFTYKNQQVDPRKIGYELNVDAIVTGRVVQQGDTLIIYAHLVNAKDGSEIWGHEYKRKLIDVLAIQEEISSEIFKNLRSELSGGAQKFLAKHQTENPEAYQLYLKGRHHWFKYLPEDYKLSLKYFQQAIEKDPTYAMAYAGMAHVYVTMAYEGLLPPAEGCEKAHQAAQKALEFDNFLAESHGAMGAVNTCLLDITNGIRAYNRAIELNPNVTEPRRFLSQAYRNLGDWDKAISEAKTVQESDPLSLESNFTLGATYYWAGRYDMAIAQYKKILELDQNYAKVHDGLSDVYAKKKMYKEAIEEQQRFLTLSGDQEGAEILGKDFKVYGYSNAMLRQYNRVLQYYNEVAEEQYVSPITFVVIYSQLNRKDEAFAWLEKAVQEKSPWLFYIKTNPQYQNLHSDARLNELLHKVGL